MKETMELESEKGFYIGDLSYAVGEDVLHGWLSGGGLPAGIAGWHAVETRDGDCLRQYVNGSPMFMTTGWIGVVPLENADPVCRFLGEAVETAGRALACWEDGVLSVAVGDSYSVRIDASGFACEYDCMECMLESEE